jgi:hypothetical protein
MFDAEMKTRTVCLWYCVLFAVAAIADDHTTVLASRQKRFIELNASLPSSLGGADFTALLLKDAAFAIATVLVLWWAWEKRPLLSGNGQANTFRAYCMWWEKPGHVPIVIALLWPPILLLSKAFAVVNNLLLLSGTASPYAEAIRLAESLGGIHPRNAHMMLQGLLGVAAAYIAICTLYLEARHRTKRCSGLAIKSAGVDNPFVASR